MLATMVDSQYGSWICGLVALVSIQCGGPGRAPTPSPVAETECRDCSSETSAAVDTNWHPDPDGDGIPSASDICPDVYDVAQGDIDADGVGDFCDDDFVTLREGGPIVDLRAQHVTPYGAWFAFTSPKTTRYGQDYVIAWSTKAEELSSGKRIRDMAAASKHGFRVFDYAGSKTARPQIITEMAPKTKYYVAIAPLDDYDKPTDPVSNLAVITTATAPVMHIPATSPRVLATPGQLTALRKRRDAGDKSFATWERVMGDSVLAAAREGSEHDFGECLSAALLFHGTGRKAYRAAALSLIESMRAFWQSRKLENNQLRWADANLGFCADLMWNELSNPQRNAIVAAYLDDDEAADIARMVDTDEYASITRTWIVDGLVGCGAEGISDALSQRACALLERGKRAFYGVQLVKARRNQGFFAQSGGNLPDGIGYAFGTSTYWLKTLIALGNVGAETDVYTPWVWNNLQAMQIQSLTPKRRGFATFGDLDSYDNFGVEPNSHPVLAYNGGLVAMHMGLLDRAGQVQKARRARWHMDNLFPKDDFGGTWAMLLFAHDGLAPLANDGGLPTSFFDKSMGMIFDRTGWSEAASFFTFRAGWSGADHTHEDAGAFQLYRNGAWVTNEALGYDGPSSAAEGHNVPALEVGFDDGRFRTGQFRLEASRPARVLRQSSTKDYAHVVADLTGPYTSGRHHSFSYESVERHLLWLKASANNTDDRVISFDRIVRSPKGAKAKVGWQMHINAKAEVHGARATFETGSKVELTLVLPADETLRYEGPQGVHSQYPGERYTSRLVSKTNQSSPELHYLAVLRASDKDTPEAVLAVQSNIALGATTGSDVIIFPKSAAGFPPSDLAIDIPSQDAKTVYWTGLAADTGYTLTHTALPRGARLTLSLGGTAKTDAAGVLQGRLER